VQVTRDGGKTWTQRGRQRPGAADECWVSSIAAGQFDEGTVYATFDAHTFGDMRPYVYGSTDFGKTWSPLVAPDSPVRGYAHVVKEDPVNKQLLFLGTEFGLWVSIDGGAGWAHYKGGDLPSVAVRDLGDPPRAITIWSSRPMGGAIWIVDDITPLEALTPETLATMSRSWPRPTVQRCPLRGMDREDRAPPHSAGRPLCNAPNPLAVDRHPQPELGAEKEELAC